MAFNKQKTTLISILVSILFLAGILYFNSENQPEQKILAPEDKGSLASDVSDKSLESDMKRIPSSDVLPYKSAFGPLPGTLEGTIMQQSLVVDEMGNLRISSDLKRIFDFFLATIEEEELSVILNRIQEYLDYTLDEPALSQALDVMNQYIAFKKALFDFEIERTDSIKQIMEQGGDAKGLQYLSLLKEQLQAQKDLRTLHLSPEVHTEFYADEEDYDSYSLDRMEVSADKSLTEEERQARYAEIDANAPEGIVASRKEAQITDILKTKTEALKSQGASQQEIKALRTEMLGVEAAERFDSLDQQRAEWNTRIETYLSQRRSILDNEGLSVDDKQDQIQQLKQNNFDSREQIRLGVYERQADAVD